MTLSLSGLSGLSTTNEIGLTTNHTFAQSGKVIQTVTVRSDVRNTYSAPTSGIGTVITPLNLVITPKRLDSVIWLRWTIHGEAHHETMLVVHRGSTLIGYNRDRGNVRFSGILTFLYDNDYGSTPSSYTVNWFDDLSRSLESGAAATQFTYSLACRSASGAAYTLALNRPNGNTGADGNEVGVSFGWAREIAR
jgi:hypothetical protein